MELLAIIRRIDTDGDAAIAYSEFAEFVRPAIPGPRVSSIPPLRSSSPPRHSSSPLKSSSPMRSSSPARVTYSSPIRPSVSPSRLSPSR
jgi:hypothetical protein